MNYSLEQRTRCSAFYTACSNRMSNGPRQGTLSTGADCRRLLVRRRPLRSFPRRRAEGQPACVVWLPSWRRRLQKEDLRIRCDQCGCIGRNTSRRSQCTCKGEGQSQVWRQRVECCEDCGEPAAPRTRALPANSRKW